MGWKRKHTAKAVVRRPWRWVVFILTGVGLYDLFIAQFVPNPIVLPRIIDLPTRLGLPWQTWAVLLLVALLIMLFEGAHHHISSFENRRLDRVHVELWGYGTHSLPRKLGEPWRSAHSITLSVTNTSESIPLGIVKFFLVVPRGPLSIDPVHPDEIQGLIGDGGNKQYQYENPLPLSLYLKPKESASGLLLFIHDDKGRTQKLYIVDEGGTSWTVDIDGSKLLKMAKRRAKETREL